MAPNTSTDPIRPPPATARRRARGCRIAALVFLLLAVIGAGAVYWVGARQPDLSNDPSMLGFNRATDHQMGVLYGKQGQLIEDFDEWIKQPGAQAILTFIAGAVMAGGCFFYGRLLDWEADQPAGATEEDGR